MPDFLISDPSAERDKSTDYMMKGKDGAQYKAKDGKWVRAEKAKE